MLVMAGLRGYFSFIAELYNYKICMIFVYLCIEKIIKPIKSRVLGDLLW